MDADRLSAVDTGRTGGVHRQFPARGHRRLRARRRVLRRRSKPVVVSALEAALAGRRSLLRAASSGVRLELVSAKLFGHSVLVIDLHYLY